MSDGANKAFLANPESWLRQNLLMCDINSVVAGRALAHNPKLGEMRNRFEAGVVIDCNIEKSLDHGRTPGGQTRLAWRLRAPESGAGLFSHRFKAYYLPYRPNDVRTMRLDPQEFPPGADFFFTDTINGCSIAAGPGAAPKVGHFNRTVGGVAGAMIDQGAIDHDIGAAFSGGTVIKLTKGSYKTTVDGSKASVGAEATFVGIRQGNRWDFFWQGPRDLAGYTDKDKRGASGKIWEVPANMLIRADNRG